MPARALNRLLLPAFGWPASQHDARNGRWPGKRTLVELFAQDDQVCQAAADALEQVVIGDKMDVFLGEVEPSFDVGEQVEQILAELLQWLGHAAGKLCQRVLQLIAAGRVDDAENRLRARQVELAREKRTHGEFARERRTGAGLQTVGDQRIKDRPARQRVQLDHVLPGVAARSGEVVDVGGDRRGEAGETQLA